MLKTIFNSLLPTNIKDIKLVTDTLDIFINYIETNSNISIDIKNIYDQNNAVIKEEFLKVYFRLISDVFNSAQNGDELHNAFINDKLINLDGNFIPPAPISISKLTNEEEYIAQKLTKTIKGTPVSFKTAYDFALNSGFLGNVYNELGIQYQYSEGKNVFEYNVIGSMSPEIYALLIAPLVHPLGWSYVYSRLQTVSVIDYFDVDAVYKITDMYVNTLGANTFDNYLTGIDYNGQHLPTYVDTWNSSTNYIAGDVVQLSGSFWLCLVDNANSQPTQNNANWNAREHSIKLIEKFTQVRGLKTVVTFLTGEILEYSTYPISLILYSDHTRQTILIDYNSNNNYTQPSLLLNYVSDIKTTVTDNITWNEDINVDDYADFNFGGVAYVKGNFTGTISQTYTITTSLQTQTLVTNDIIFYAVKVGSGYGIVGEYYKYVGTGLTQDLNSINFLDTVEFTPLINTWTVQADFTDKTFINSFTVAGNVYTKRIYDDLVIQVL